MPPADAGPDAVAVGSGEPKCGTTGQKIQRPKITSSAGKSVIIASSATATPIAATGPRPRGGVHLGDEQARACSATTVARAGDDRRARPVQGQRHRLVPVLVPAQLLAVAGDQQQGVVGARAEDQHGEDAGALPVDGQAGVPGEEVDQRLRR